MQHDWTDLLERGLDMGGGHHLTTGLKLQIWLGRARWLAHQYLALTSLGPLALHTFTHINHACSRKAHLCHVCTLDAMAGMQAED